MKGTSVSWKGLVCLFSEGRETVIREALEVFLYS